MELLAQKKHPDQFNLIPNEPSDEFDGVPVAIANQGYSYHLWGDINDEVQTWTDVITILKHYSGEEAEEKPRSEYRRSFYSVIVKYKNAE